jgi:hypothetical protein
MTALSQAIGQMEGAKDSVARLMKKAMNMRECQLAIRIAYMAHKRSEIVIGYDSDTKAQTMQKFSLHFAKVERQIKVAWVRILA